MGSSGMQDSHGWLDTIKSFFFACSDSKDPRSEYAAGVDGSYHVDGNPLGDDEVLNRSGPEKRYFQVFYDQPRPMGRPRAVSPRPASKGKLQKDSRRAAGRQTDMGWLERNFRAGKRKAPRPLISDPFNFQHTGTGAVNAFMTSAPDLPRSAPPFRPLQLSIYEQDNQISPLLPHFTDADDALTHPERALTRNSGRDTFDEDATTLAHSRSYSSLSFHIPRRPLNEASSFATATASNFGDSPPRIPPRARTRPRAYTSPSVEAIVERIASAIIERDIILEEIESVKERQSISLSRPGSAYGQFPRDTEPMPTIPAMPPSAPSFAERVSIERPRTAPSTQSTFNKAYPPPPQPFANRSQSFDAPGASQHPTSATPVKPVPASAFNSHPPWRSPQIIDNSLDIEVPLAPPLPLVLRPPLRKKKSFSRVSSWLFPAGVEDREQPAPQRQHRRDVSLDSVTNAPTPLTDRDGFYQILPPSAVFSGRRSSFDSMSDITRSGTHSVYSTDEDPFIGPGTATATSNWSPGSTPPEVARRKDSATSRVGGHGASLSLTRSGTFGSQDRPIEGPRPTSVGVAF
ncbi:hypothetical protein VM1G_10537 [Cytospora mali]|uniref:Uncharacterized protein n=1 Tax=Cytospora mali TaxID=578113 RepID=A0A194VI30_CYTMA|nr:hypothetical protein VM1G_10537 [Valsa mali]